MNFCVKIVFFVLKQGVIMKSKHNDVPWFVKEEKRKLSTTTKMMPSNNVAFHIDSEDEEERLAALNFAIIEYYKRFKDKLKYIEPKVSADKRSVEFSFSSDDEASEFFYQIAQQGMCGTIVDADTRKVMGFMKSGKLYHTNGDEFRLGDTLKLSEMDISNFQLPKASTNSCSL